MSFRTAVRPFSALNSAAWIGVRFLVIMVLVGGVAPRALASGSYFEVKYPGSKQTNELVYDVAQPAAQFAHDPKEAGWLPNERVAKAWEQYVKYGATDDTTPPPAPTNVKATRTAKGVELTWDAEVDFESGQRAFVIQRDGKDFAQFPEKPQNKFGRPLFQNMSYGDTCVEPLLDFKFVDATAKPGKHHAYRVIAVNSVELRSKPSRSATVR